MSAGIVHLNIERLIDAAYDMPHDAPQNMSMGRGGELEPRREYIGASIVGQECERALWYKFRWWTREEFPARIRRRFETGDTYETRVIAWLEMAGFEVRHINDRARNPKQQFRGELFAGLLSGHVDGFVRHPELLPEWALLEIKAVVSAKYKYSEGEPIGNRTDLKEYRSGGHNLEGGWWRLKRLGVKENSRTHYAQMQTYMGLSREKIRDGSKLHYEAWGFDRPITRALYVAVNTDTDQVYDELIEYDAKWFRAAKARTKRVAAATMPPDRVSDMPIGFPCEWCDYQHHCHGIAEPERNCRTCAHSEIKIPGDPGYYGTQVAWLCSEHGRSCGEFTPCPQWAAIEEEESF